MIDAQLNLTVGNAQLNPAIDVSWQTPLINFETVQPWSYGGGRNQKLKTVLKKFLKCLKDRMEVLKHWFSTLPGTRAWPEQSSGDTGPRPARVPGKVENQ